jgi:hypothetical protein
MRGQPDLPLLVVESIITALRASAPVLTQVDGDARAIRQTRKFAELLIPSVGVQQIDDSDSELEGVVLVQFDFFQRTLTLNRALRNAVLRVVHNDYHRDLGALEVYSLYQGGRRLDDPSASCTHLQTDIQYHAYREYA